MNASATEPADDNTMIPDSPNRAAESDPRPAGLPWWAGTPTGPAPRIRKHTLRGALTGTATTLAVLLGVGLALAGGNQPDSEPASIRGVNATLHHQTTQALLAGCGGVYTLTDTIETSGTLPADHPVDRIRYGLPVPVYGPMLPAPVDTTQQTYWATGDDSTPHPATLLHNQWNGDLIAYYTEDANPTDIRNLRKLATENPAWRMLVVPWPEDRDPLPNERKIAFAAWGIWQTCARVNANALNEFRTAYPASAAPGYDGTPPPAYTGK